MAVTEETITILNVETGEAVKSINDLKSNIKLLKKDLGELEVGSQEYQDTLEELKINQNALKDAMYATSASMEDVASAATGTAESYNSLVHRMASLKEELRSTDVSTEAGMARFKELASQINGVNDRLKEMDALQGNYQRNVGNYKSALDGLSDLVSGMPESLGKMKGGLDTVDKSMRLMSTNPIIGIAGLLVPIVNGLASGLKDNETATNAVKKAMDALTPVMTAVKIAVETVAGWISKAVDFLVEFTGAHKEAFSTFIAGAVGVGNTILQFILTPVRSSIEAVKGLGTVIGDVFTGRFKKAKEDAVSAIAGIKDAFQRGISFEENFKAGRDAGAAFIAGLGDKSTKAKAGEAGKEVGDSFAEELEKAINDAVDEAVRQAEEELAQAEKDAENAGKMAKSANDRRLQGITDAEALNKRRAALEIEDESELAARLYEIQEGANQRRLEALRQFAQDALESGDVSAYLEYSQQAADLEIDIEMSKLEEMNRLEEDAQKKSDERAQSRIANLQAVAGATGSILGSIADMYEADEESAEKNAGAIKNMRIAGAVIDMLSGVVTAIAQAQQLGPIAGPIMAAINSAAVIAAGTAQIASMKATKVDGSASTGTTAPATVSAPSVTFTPTQVRNTTGATEEERLNQMASKQRVYIVQSDIEAAADQTKTQVAETTF